MAIYLKNANFIDWETLNFKTTNIKVEEGNLGKISFPKTIPQNIDNSEIIDCSGKIVTKSFANAHHHIYSALACGMPAPNKNPKNFVEILKYIWWNLDKNLDKDIIEASALSAAIECAKNGVTFVIDHHSSPFAIDGSLQIISDAFEKVGISNLLCYEISDRDGKSVTEKAFVESENFMKQKQALIGLHALFTVGDDTLNKAVSLSESYNSGIHIHVAEDVFDQTFSEKEYNKRVVERLKYSGALDFSKTILAHCLHISDNEREILKSSKAFIVQNTESNLNNTVGFFNAKNFEDKVMIGTDGMHSDIIRSAKSAYFVGKNFENIDYLSAYQRLRKVHKYLSQNNFAGDGENNLVVLNYKSATEINESNFLGHFLFGIESKHVEHVISSGKLIIKNGEINTVDEKEIQKFSQEMSKKLWSSL